MLEECIQDVNESSEHIGITLLHTEYFEQNLHTGQGFQN
jgi:hypothetical protein